MKYFITIIIMFFPFFSALSQNIQGKVLEIRKDSSFSPIFGANVYWEGTTVGTVTNFKGEYSIEEAPSFPATLNVSFVGYSLDSKEVINDKYIFYLKSSIDLKEVNIKGKQNTTKISIKDPLNIQTISTGEIQKAACCNLSECFETNASVDVSYSDAISGLKTIKMLGLDGKYVKINNESMPLMTGLLNSYGLSYVPGSWIESIQILKGMGSVVNGHDAITGEINLEYFKPVADAERLMWNFYTNGEGKLENNLILSSNKGKWGANLFTHISYLGREIDHHGSSHNHHSHSDHHGDGFLDAPKIKQFNLLNKWKYTGDNFRLQIYLKGLLEERIGGQKTGILDRYIVDIYNELLEINTKTGYVFSNKRNQTIGLQTAYREHKQNAQFGDNIFNGKQQRFYMNLISVTDLWSINHTLKYGLSYSVDRFNNNLTGNMLFPHTVSSYYNLIKDDLITGAYLEYNYKLNENFNLNTGLRSDYYNITKKIYYSPRINIKYNPNDQSVVRFSLGKGFRIPNIIADNMYLLASSRDIMIDYDNKPEIAWNFGSNFSYCFYLFSREGTFNFDVYRTVFENMIIVDIMDADRVSFYNMIPNKISGEKNFSNTIQFDLSYEIFERYDVKLSYKINNARFAYRSKESQNTSSTYFSSEIPFSPKSRGMINLAYSTISEKWKYDFTANYVGSSFMPDYYRDIPEINGDDNYTDPFTVCNTQITHKRNDFDIYVGVENIFSYVQKNPIIDAENPFSENFDASLIYGPVMGRLFYMGLRYSFK